MNVSSINNTNPLDSITSSFASNTQSAPADTSSISIGDAAQAHVSGPAQLMSKLAQLKTADPDKFKAVVADIASKLKDAASQATGHTAQFLSTLASKFQDVANGGDLSELKPGGAGGSGAPGGAGGPQGGHHAHHHHGGGGGSSAMSSTLSSIFDEVDQALNATQAASTSSDGASTTAS